MNELEEILIKEKELKEQYLNKEIKCLDKGFVRLVDFMGADVSVVQAARVSYGKGTKTKNEDRGLIRYMMKHRHTSPFEQVEFKFHVKLPIFCARQMVRHRTASLNEVSGRYSEMPDECYIPEQSRLQIQSGSNKQGSEDTPVEEGLKIQTSMMEEQTSVFSNYNEYLETGLSREVSRIDLPLSTYTQWYWKMDLHNLFHFLKLRLDEHAQWEIRVYAQAIYELIKPIVPLSCEAFEDYVLNSETFSAKEMIIIKELLSKSILQTSTKTFFREKAGELGLSKREEKELFEKIGHLPQ